MVPALTLQLHSRRGALDVHEFDGTFQGTRVHFRMTSVIGHVYSLDFHSAYNSWDKVSMQGISLAVNIVLAWSAGTASSQSSFYCKPPQPQQIVPGHLLHLGLLQQPAQPLNTTPSLPSISSAEAAADVHHHQLRTISCSVQCRQGRTRPNPHLGRTC
jgi:hypothetical protein